MRSDTGGSDGLVAGAWTFLGADSADIGEWGKRRVVCVFHCTPPMVWYTPASAPRSATESTAPAAAGNSAIAHSNIASVIARRERIGVCRLDKDLGSSTTVLEQPPLRAVRAYSKVLLNSSRKYLINEPDKISFSHFHHKNTLLENLPQGATGTGIAEYGQLIVTSLKQVL